MCGDMYSPPASQCRGLSASGHGGSNRRRLHSARATWPGGSRTLRVSIVARYAVGLLQVINYRSNMSTEFFHRLLLGLLTRSSFSYGTSDLSCGVRCSIHVRTEAMVGTSCPSFFCMPLVWVCSLMNSPTFLRGGKPMRITMRCPPYLARRCSSC